MGLFDPISDALFGKPPKAKTSGAFEGIGELGGAFSDFLLERLQTPIGETQQFQQGSQIIRDVISTQGATARQRLGDVATTGGFLDSGAVLSGLGDIERQSTQAFASEISQLILALEDRREQGILPFLSAGAGEFGAVQQANVQSETARTGQLIGGISSIVGTGFPEGF